jgi:hypothetical protein
MMIHVARDGAKLGEFTLEQIQAGLGTGQFRPTDLGWQSGMADWRPLSEFVPATASAASAAPAAPVVVAGASTAAAGYGLPWENRAQLGLFQGWFQTVSLLITRPADGFAMMRPEGGLTDPLLFGLIGGSAGSIVSFAFQFLLRSIPGMSHNDIYSDMFGLAPGVLFIIAAILTPIFVVLGLFISSGILHLCLMLVGGANRGFETTFRVLCFASGTANLFNMVPMCGGLIAAVYSIVLNCTGLSRAHQTTTGKAVLAIFLPMIVCCVLVVVFGIVLGGFGAFGGYLNRHSH